MPERGDAAHAVIVLAAGRSTRLGQPKQLLEVEGESLLRRAVRFAAQTAPLEILVVLDDDTGTMRDQLAGLAWREVACADAALGMAASLRRGLAGVDPRCAGALIVLTDQPALDGAHLCALVSEWQTDPQRAVASAYAGILGVPAVLPRASFAELLTGAGDRGAREWLRRRADDVESIAAPQLAFDVDAPGDLAEWRTAWRDS